MTYGTRSLKSEARQIQKDKSILYTEALELAVANRADVVEEVFAEKLHEASVKIVERVAGQIDIDKVSYFEVAFEVLFDTLSASGATKEYVNSRLGKAVKQALVLDSENGVERDNASEYIGEIANVAVSLLEAVDA